MRKKVAIIIIHGVVFKEDSYPSMEKMKKKLIKQSNELNPDIELVFSFVKFADCFQNNEEELIERLTDSGGRMDYMNLRKIFIDFGGDAIAYQPTKSDSAIYDEIHYRFAVALKKLQTKVDEDTPLCVISHSLGTVITSNFFYDLNNTSNNDRYSFYSKEEDKTVVCQTDFEKGNTLKLIVTMGSPLPIWALRCKNLDSDFNDAIEVDNWLNFYDKDDILGFPLRGLNPTYKNLVTDFEINSGNLFINWNPLCHNGYWTDKDVIKPIAKELKKIFAL